MNSGSRWTLLPGVALLVLAAAFSFPRGASASTVPCGTITVRLAGNDFSYRVRVERGRIACPTARMVLRSFIATSRAPAGWACFRGHGVTRWAAACAGVRRPTRGVIVRAYLIAG